jgi:glycoprotein 6-alpha-L-fucosyltransferase
MEVLSRNDGYNDWRYRELKVLGESVEERFQRLQNPKDCDNMKILKCYSDTSNCGWGCQVHHIIECLTLALGTSRTVLYDASEFKYGPGNFEKIYQNITLTDCPIPYTRDEKMWLR